MWKDVGEDASSVIGPYHIHSTIATGWSQRKRGPLSIHPQSQSLTSPSSSALSSLRRITKGAVFHDVVHHTSVNGALSWIIHKTWHCQGCNGWGSSVEYMDCATELSVHLCGFSAPIHSAIHPSFSRQAGRQAWRMEKRPLWICLTASAWITPIKAGFRQMQQHNRQRRIKWKAHHEGWRRQRRTSFHMLLLSCVGGAQHNSSHGPRHFDAHIEIPRSRSIVWDLGIKVGQCFNLEFACVN